MKYKLFILLTGITLLWVSCQTRHESGIKTDTTQLATRLEGLKKEYKSTKNDSTLLHIAKLYGQSVRETSDPAEKETLLIDIIEFCRNSQNNSISTPFEEELNKLSPQNQKNAEFLFQSGKNLKEIDENEMAYIFFKALSTRFPDDDRNEQIMQELPADFDAALYIRKLAENIYKNPDTLGMNYLAAVKYTEACRNFALANPSLAETPEYLFRAAEMSRALSQFKQMMYYYNWITEYYPQYQKMPLVLLSKGFYLETEFKRLDDARQTYQLFLEKFPDDPLANDVRALLENFNQDPVKIIRNKNK